MRRPVNPAPTVAESTIATASDHHHRRVSGRADDHHLCHVVLGRHRAHDELTAEIVTTTSAPPTSVVDVASELVLLPDGVGRAASAPRRRASSPTSPGSLGPPTADSGWVDPLESPFGACSGERVRGVQWGAAAVAVRRRVVGQLGAGGTSSRIATAGSPTSRRSPAGSAHGQPVSCSDPRSARSAPPIPEVTVFEDEIFGAGVLDQPGRHQRDLDRRLRRRAGGGALRRHRLRR